MGLYTRKNVRKYFISQNLRRKSEGPYTDPRPFNNLVKFFSQFSDLLEYSLQKLTPYHVCEHHIFARKIRVNPKIARKTLTTNPVRRNKLLPWQIVNRKNSGEIPEFAQKIRAIFSPKIKKFGWKRTTRVACSFFH